MGLTNTTTVTGSLYDSRTGTKITSGSLFLRLKNWTGNGPDIVAPTTVEYAIPGTGDISLDICPSNGVAYVVEFDPDPSDTTTPRRLKDGYFSNTWDIPYPGPVDIVSL